MDIEADPRERILDKIWRRIEEAQAAAHSRHCAALAGADRARRQTLREEFLLERLDIFAHWHLSWVHDVMSATTFLEEVKDYAERKLISDLSRDHAVPASLRLKVAGRILNWKAKALKRVREFASNPSVVSMAPVAEEPSVPGPKLAQCVIVSISGLKRWCDLYLKFTANENLRVFIDSQDRGVYTFAQLGFALSKARRPTKAWETLLDLAKAGSQGISTYEEGQRRETVRSRVRLINAALTRVFGLDDPAIHFAHGQGQPSFRLEPPPRIRNFRDVQ